MISEFKSFIAAKGAKITFPRIASMRTNGYSHLNLLISLYEQNTMDLTEKKADEWAPKKVLLRHTEKIGNFLPERQQN